MFRHNSTTYKIYSTSKHLRRASRPGSVATLWVVLQNLLNEISVRVATVHTPQLADSTSPIDDLSALEDLLTRIIVKVRNNVPKIARHPTTTPRTSQRAMRRGLVRITAEANLFMNDKKSRRNSVPQFRPPPTSP